MYLTDIKHQEASNASLVQDKDPSKIKYNAPRSSHPFFIIKQHFLSCKLSRAGQDLINFSGPVQGSTFLQDEILSRSFFFFYQPQQVCGHNISQWLRSFSLRRSCLFFWGHSSVFQISDTKVINNRRLIQIAKLYKVYNTFQNIWVCWNKLFSTHFHSLW